MILIILGLAFYWFQWRPTQIRKECYSTSFNIFDGISDSNRYIDCLKQHGLEK